MSFGDAGDDGEAESVPAGGSRPASIGPVEAIEEVRFVLWGNSRSLILNRDLLEVGQRASLEAIGLSKEWLCLAGELLLFDTGKTWTGLPTAP